MPPLTLDIAPRPFLRRISMKTASPAAHNEAIKAATIMASSPPRLVVGLGFAAPLVDAGDAALVVLPEGWVLVLVLPQALQSQISEPARKGHCAC